jgi:hypothetical protein
MSAKEWSPAGQSRAPAIVARKMEQRSKHLLAGLQDMSPAYFAMVMATGIVSLAAHMQGLSRMATALFWLNLAAWGVLWLLSALRLARHPQRFFGDLVDHLRGPGFFTMVAGTAVLGSQFAILEANGRLARSEERRVGKECRSRWSPYH